MLSSVEIQDVIRGLHTIDSETRSQSACPAWRGRAHLGLAARDHLACGSPASATSSANCLASLNSSLACLNVSLTMASPLCLRNFSKTTRAWYTELRSPFTSGIFRKLGKCWAFVLEHSELIVAEQVKTNTSKEPRCSEKQGQGRGS